MRKPWFRGIQGNTGVKSQDVQEHKNEVLGFHSVIDFS